MGFISPVASFTPKTVETTDLRTSLVYEVRIFVKDPADELRLGMPATVQIPLTAGDSQKCSGLYGKQGRLMGERALGADILSCEGLTKEFTWS